MQFLTALLFATSVVAQGTAPLYFRNYFGDSPGLLEVGKSYTVDWTAKKDYVRLYLALPGPAPFKERKAKSQPLTPSNASRMSRSSS